MAGGAEENLMPRFHQRDKNDNASQVVDTVPDIQHRAFQHGASADFPLEKAGCSVDCVGESDIVHLLEPFWHFRGPWNGETDTLGIVLREVIYLLWDGESAGLGRWSGVCFWR